MKRQISEVLKTSEIFRTMLTDRQYQLLTAYIDGEMDPRDREAALRLLEESAEARVVLQKLQADALKVRNLPRARLDAQFPKQVIAAVVRPTRASARRFHPIGIGMAAAVLLAVTLGAWLLINSGKQQDPVAPVPFVQAPKEKPQAPEAKYELNPQVAELIQGTFNHYGLPVPDVGKRLAVNDPSLVKELAALAEPAARLEVRCRDSSEVLTRLQNALSADGVKLWVDSRTQRQLTRGEPAEYLVLIENLRPAQVAKLIAQASAGEQFDSVLFNPLQFEHRKELSALLGVSVFRLEMSRFDEVPIPREELGIGKNGQAVRPKTNVAPTNAVPVERVALVSSAAGEGRGVASSETLRFLNSRRGNRPGTLQVVIVLHQSL